MDNYFTFSQFSARFANDDVCLEEIKRMRYPHGIHCPTCNNITMHYRVRNRTAYACKFCRNQVYPLAGTIFAKTTTPLRLWFYCLFLLTQTRASFSIKQLQRELGVTYKTAWRMYTQVKLLMEQNNGDLLSVSDERIRKWTFFNRIEISVVEKQQVDS